MSTSSRAIDRLETTFDHDGLVANAGLIVTATLMTRLGLWPDWRHHAFITNTTLDAVAADEFHRAHATVELAIRDLKDGGLEHVPSGHFHANGVWLASAVLAHNLNRWTTALADQVPVNNRTLRTRLTALTAVVVNRSGQLTLRFPTRWPWAPAFTATLAAIRALPAASG